MKTQFLKNFNITLYLLMSTAMNILIVALCHFIRGSLSTTTLSPLINLSKGFYSLASFSLICSILSLLGAVAVAYQELYERYTTSELSNYFKSFYQTLTLRRFLKQSEHSLEIATPNHQTRNTINPVNQEFNRAIRKSGIDIRYKAILACIQLPRTQQSQKILKDMEEQIREELSAQNPDYFFSAPERRGNTLCFKGTRR